MNEFVGKIGDFTGISNEVVFLIIVFGSLIVFLFIGVLIGDSKKSSGDSASNSVGFIAGTIELVSVLALALLVLAIGLALIGGLIWLAITHPLYAIIVLLVLILLGGK